MGEVRERAKQECKLIVKKGLKIALLRDLALEFGCDADLVADLQRHYSVKRDKLNLIKQEHGL